MADNYLEKRMEAHLRGEDLPRSRRKISPSGPVAGTIALPFPPGLKVVISGEDDALPQLIGALVSAGCKVAFTCPDYKAGQALAQKSGARHLPVAHDDSEAFEALLPGLTRAWLGAPDVIIKLGADSLPGCAGSLYIGEPQGFKASLCRLGIPRAEVAAVLYTLLPQSRQILSPGYFKL